VERHALEVLRFGLGLMPDPKVTTCSGHRTRTLLVKANLGQNGQLSIELRTKTG